MRTTAKQSILDFFQVQVLLQTQVLSIKIRDMTNVNRKKSKVKIIL